jgi:hypothetical protein
MGWTYSHKDKGISVKDFFSEEFNFKKNEKVLKVIDGFATISEAYLAIETITRNSRKVFAVVCRIHYNSKEQFNFGYKDMDEAMGPYYYNCPERILKLFTPTTNKYAIKWRKKCWEKSERTKARPKFRINDILKFKKSVLFNNGYRIKRVKVVDRRRFIFECLIEPSSPGCGIKSFNAIITQHALNTNPYIVTSRDPLNY